MAFISKVLIKREKGLEIAHEGAFRRKSQAMAYAAQWSDLTPSALTTIDEMPWGQAVGIVRRTVFLRDDHECVRCGNPVTWDSMHMNERKQKSLGGAVTTENCETLCFECHNPSGTAGPFGEHGNRRAQWSKKRR